VIGFGTGALLGTAAIVLGFLALRDLQRTERIRQHVEYTNQVRRVTERLLAALGDRQAGAELDSMTVSELSAQISILAGMHSAEPLDSDAMERLRSLVRDTGQLSEERLDAGLDLTRDVMAAEIRLQDRLLEQTQQDIRFEVALAVTIIGALVTMLLLGGLIVRRRFLKPLEDLRGLFHTVAERDFRAVSTEEIDPILIPLFDNYNYLVNRLEMLEEEHRLRAQSLENEVRSATQALLEQHRSLANAERLAAVGEMAAGVAHELRNPLAGIAMSLGNLRQEVADPDVAERLNMLVSEIERVSGLLEQYLSSARHAPERARKVDIGELVASLLHLLQYQVPQHIVLENRVHESIACVVPRNRLRQVLLNLVLNSVQALGKDEGVVVIDASRNGSELSVSVCDDGPGFPQEILRGRVRAFGTQRSTGTGLGLIMVKRVVEELGGKMNLSNREPHGACVTLTFPVGYG